MTAAGGIGRKAVLGAVPFVLLVIAAPAASQTVTVPDAEGTVGGVTSTVTQVVGTLQQTFGTTGSAAATGGSGVTTAGGSSARSGSSGDQAGNRWRANRHRTAFDRLPRRLERLLERIEFGQDVRANLERLERWLANASPAMRARVLRLLRAEVRRLERGGVTPAERASIRRLDRAEDVIRGPGTPVGVTTSSPQAAGMPFTGPALTGGAQTPSEAAGDDRAGGGVLDARAGAEGEAQGPLLPGLPDGSGTLPTALGLILLALLGLGFLGLAYGVASHIFGRPRSS